MNYKEAAIELIRNQGLQNVQRIAKSGNEPYRAMATTIITNCRGGGAYLMVRKIVDADKKYVGVSISLPPESIRLIDSGRGQQSRSAFINDLVKSRVVE